MQNVSSLSSTSIPKMNFKAGTSNNYYQGLPQDTVTGSLIRRHGQYSSLMREMHMPRTGNRRIFFCSKFFITPIVFWEF